MSILTLVKTKAEFSMITVLKLKTKLKTRGASVCLIKSRVKYTPTRLSSFKVLFHQHDHH